MDLIMNRGLGMVGLWLTYVDCRKQAAPFSMIRIHYHKWGRLFVLGGIYAGVKKYLYQSYTGWADIGR